MDPTTRERQAMREVVHRLVRSFADSVPPEQVTRTVTTVHHRFDGKPVRDFVPVLVERFAREELRSSAGGGR